MAMFGFSFVILDILEESRLYKHIKDIVPSIGYNSCNEKDKCTDWVYLEPSDSYITFAYPSMKFTFSFPDVIPGGSFYTYAYAIFLKKKIACQLLLEDKERFTKRPVTWTKEFIDQADLEFSGKNHESTVYEFALSIR